MIKTKIDDRFKRAEKYKVPKKIVDKNTKEAFADLFFSENQNYCLLYSLLEDIEFSIYHEECKEVGEIRDFIKKYKDIYVYPKCEFDLDD